MDVNIKNTSNQSICVNLSGGRGLKLRSGEIVQVNETDLQCPEMLFFQKEGSIVTLKKLISIQPKQIQPIEESEQKPEADKSKDTKPKRQPNIKKGDK